jgi:hypothetical protein
MSMADGDPLQLYIQPQERGKKKSKRHKGKKKKKVVRGRRGFRRQMQAKSAHSSGSGGPNLSPSKHVEERLDCLTCPFFFCSVS